MPGSPLWIALWLLGTAELTLEGARALRGMLRDPGVAKGPWDLPCSKEEGGATNSPPSHLRLGSGLRSQSLQSQSTQLPEKRG